LHLRVAVHNKHTLLVGPVQASAQLAAVDGGEQVDFARPQAPQHDRGDAEVNGMPDVALAEVVRRAAVQEHEAAGVGAQLPQQPLLGDDPVGGGGQRGWGRRGGGRRRLGLRGGRGSTHRTREQ